MPMCEKKKKKRRNNLAEFPKDLHWIACVCAEFNQGSGWFTGSIDIVDEECKRGVCSVTVTYPSVWEILRDTRHPPSATRTMTKSQRYPPRTPLDVDQAKKELTKAGANALEKHMAQSTTPFAFPSADGEGAFCVTRIMLTEYAKQPILDITMTKKIPSHTMQVAPRVSLACSASLSSFAILPTRHNL
jgi:hypothetical protein